MNKNLITPFLGGVLGALFVTNLFFFLFILYIYSGIKFKSWGEKEGENFTLGEIIAVMAFSPFLWALNGIHFLVSSGANVKFRSPIIISEDK